MINIHIIVYNNIKMRGLFSFNYFVFDIKVHRNINSDLLGVDRLRYFVCKLRFVIAILEKVKGLDIGNEVMFETSHEIW